MQYSGSTDSYSARDFKAIESCSTSDFETTYSLSAKE
jgi:hypothetical protein